MALFPGINVAARKGYPSWFQKVAENRISVGCPAGIQQGSGQWPNICKRIIP